MTKRKHKPSLAQFDWTTAERGKYVEKARAAFGVAGASPAAKLLAVVATFPAGERTKEEVDQQLAEDRDAWDRE